jgi:hypothetical protein
MALTFLWFRTWIGLPCSYECHACSHFLAILFRTDSNQLTGSTPSELGELKSLTVLYLDHFLISRVLNLIALLKLCAAAALYVINAVKGTYRQCHQRELYNR